jgi:hypothetical protein
MEALLDHMDWEEEIRDVEWSLTFEKEMDLSQTHSLRSPRKDFTTGVHQEIETDNTWITYA